MMLSIGCCSGEGEVAGWQGGSPGWGLPWLCSARGGLAQEAVP